MLRAGFGLAERAEEFGETAARHADVHRLRIMAQDIDLPPPSASIMSMPRSSAAFGFVLALRRRLHAFLATDKQTRRRALRAPQNICLDLSRGRIAGEWQTMAAMDEDVSRLTAAEASARLCRGDITAEQLARETMSLAFLANLTPSRRVTSFARSSICEIPFLDQINRLDRIG
jgi:hypothetical protein